MVYYAFLNTTNNNYINNDTLWQIIVLPEWIYTFLNEFPWQIPRPLYEVITTNQQQHHNKGRQIQLKVLSGCLTCMPRLSLSPSSFAIASGNKIQRKFLIYSWQNGENSMCSEGEWAFHSLTVRLFPSQRHHSLLYGLFFSSSFTLRSCSA